MFEQGNIVKELLVVSMDKQLEDISQEKYQKEVSLLTTDEIFQVVLVLTKRLLNTSDEIEGEKKIFLLTDQFELGKMLSLNLKKMGLYHILDGVLISKGQDLSVIDEYETQLVGSKVGFGKEEERFTEMLSRLEMPGDVICIKKHNLENKDLQQRNAFDLWLNKTDMLFEVPSMKGTLLSRHYIMKAATENGAAYKLHWFEPENLTAEILGNEEYIEIRRKYFVVNSAVQWIFTRMKEKQYDLRKLYKYVLIKYFDQEFSMIIPEMIRVLVEEKAFPIEEAVEVVCRVCGYQGGEQILELYHTYPEDWWERTILQLVPEMKDILGNRH